MSMVEPNHSCNTPKKKKKKAMGIGIILNSIVLVLAYLIIEIYKFLFKLKINKLDLLFDN